MKAFALTLAMVAGLLLPATLKAQSDGFFRNDEENYANRSTGGFNITTEQFNPDTGGGFNINTEQFGQTAPLGGGLLIMLAAGGAYALKKRKNKSIN